MAVVKKVNLAISGTVVKVDFTVTFEPSEVGQQFEIVVHLFNGTPPDVSGFVRPEPIFTFPFGNHALGIPTRMYRSITGRAGDVSQSISYPVDRQTIDVNPGHQVAHTPDGHEIWIPDKDYVYAEVVLSHRARSTTQSGIF